MAEDDENGKVKKDTYERECESEEGDREREKKSQREMEEGPKAARGGKPDEWEVEKHIGRGRVVWRADGHDTIGESLSQCDRDLPMSVRSGRCELVQRDRVRGRIIRTCGSDIIGHSNMYIVRGGEILRRRRYVAYPGEDACDIPLDCNQLV